MKISKVKIINFKCFENEFILELNHGINILVGNNEAGKSTILEAIHLALTGIFHGKPLKNELSQYIFNYKTLTDYYKNIKTGEYVQPPHILIELYLDGNYPEFQGINNTCNQDVPGISFEIAFDQYYVDEYNKLIISDKEIKTLPIEYYGIFWRSFASANITSRSIPIKSTIIDSSNMRFHNGSDIYIAKIIRDSLDDEDTIAISQAQRKTLETFMNDTSIKDINEKIKNNSTNISKKNIKLSVEMLAKNGWENNLITYLDDIPFPFIGKGEQCIIKTSLALNHKTAKNASVILIEEPENHLSHTKLNEFVNSINQQCMEKQVIMSTHCSFIANKLELTNLILLNKNRTMRFDSIHKETKNFFKKLPGYDTLRLLLCNKAILVEGDSDELIVQKAYKTTHSEKLPIEDGIDVISVGTTFIRFLEIAEKLGTKVVVVTDNDGDIAQIKKKYSKYLNDKTGNIAICFDECVDTGELKIGKKEDTPFNYNTLEPKLLKANGDEKALPKFNKIFGKHYKNLDDMHKYMKSHKTECALKIFEEEETRIVFPAYIMNAINEY